MKKDIEIAHSTPLKPIGEVAAAMGISPDDIEHYGKHIAKLPLSLGTSADGKNGIGKGKLYRPRIFPGKICE